MQVEWFMESKMVINELVTEGKICKHGPVNIGKDTIGLISCRDSE